MLEGLNTKHPDPGSHNQGASMVPLSLRERAGTGKGWLMGIVAVALGTDSLRAISLFFWPHVIP